MKSKNIAVISLVSVLAISGLLWWSSRMDWWTKTIPNNNTPDNFEDIGHISQSDPKQTPVVWIFTYQETANPALSKELILTAKTQCSDGVVAINCSDLDWVQGHRVVVIGVLKNDKITVSKLSLVKDVLPIDDKIILTSPTANSLIKSPLHLEGRARGNWYFEASFPVKLYDANGKLLASSAAQAKSNWMTTDFVFFSADLTFQSPTTSTGTLVLEKDNPSGLPENAEERRIPVNFEPAERTIKLYYYDPTKDRDANGNLLCSDKGLVSVERKIPITQTPIQDTINELIRGNLTLQERAGGLTTEFPLLGLNLLSANVKNGTLTLEFEDNLHRSVGGACRVGLLWAQIEATAKQFPQIKQVKWIPEDELFQP
jgi:hypothetical protein